jgi:proliferating cell nuclear antigen
MLEAPFRQGHLLRKLIDCINGIVTEANFDCSPAGLSIQAMDSSHVALVYLLLRADGFEDQKFQCERSAVLGMNLVSLTKVLKVLDGADKLLLRHEDDSDSISLVSENTDSSRRCEYQLKLMEIEAESMGIPEEMEYKSKVTMSSNEFAKIVRDMQVFGDTVNIRVERDGVRFSSSGDVGEGFVHLRSDSSSNTKGEVKAEVKAEQPVKRERAAEDDDDTPFAAKFNKLEGDLTPNKMKADTMSGVEVSIQEPVNLSFALRFMNSFSKGAALSDRITMHFASDSPCMMEFKIEKVGFLRYYLAPKVDESA